MGKTNEILRKLPVEQRADALAALLAGGGALPAEKAREFIRLVQNATPLLKAARVVEMPTPTYSLPKILFGSMIVKAAPTDGDELAAADRSAPTVSEISLVAKDYMASVKVSDKFMEDNVENESIEDTFMTLIAERVGVDLETLALASDTLGAGAYALQDGWIKRITSNVVNAASVDLTRAHLEAALVAVALRFRAQGRHAFYVEEYAGEVWRKTIGDRATALGDKAILEGTLPPAAGRPVIQVGNMPVTAGAPNTAPALFTDPRNLILGMLRNIRIETERVVREQATYIVVTFRVAFAVEHEAAASKITLVKART